MLWNAATHGLSIPRDGGDKAAGTAKRRAQPSGGHSQAARGSPPEAPGFLGAPVSSPDDPCEGRDLLGFLGAPGAPLCVSPTG
mgnify:CR=1 FL=1